MPLIRNLYDKLYKKPFLYESLGTVFHMFNQGCDKYEAVVIFNKLWNCNFKLFQYYSLFKLFVTWTYYGFGTFVHASIERLHYVLYLYHFDDYNRLLPRPIPASILANVLLAISFAFLAPASKISSNS